jgi:hypothetical protein
MYRKPPPPPAAPGAALFTKAGVMSFLHEQSQMSAMDPITNASLTILVFSNHYQHNQTVYAACSRTAVQTTLAHGHLTQLQVPT